MRSPVTEMVALSQINRTRIVTGSVPLQVIPIFCSNKPGTCGDKKEKDN